MPSDLLAGRYRILSPLGAGGMGEVFLAEDTRLERRVAVKLLPASIEADAVARERLRREALAAAALDHPFICKVYEIGDADGRVFIVMEYVEGDTLHTHSRGGLLSVRHVVDIAHELAQALDAAHRRGIVHRDLKPANVMVTPQGHVKVMDFGLAKQVAARPSPSREGAASDARTETHANAASTDARVALTDAGTRLGTPAYMSPEQILGASLDPRSDLFSLGIILHELATGRHPFLRDDPSDTMAAILRDPPTPGSRDADEPAGFGAVIHRLLSKACAERHQTSAALLDDLEALRANAWSSSRTTTTAPATPAERTPFVGRDIEATELTRLLDQMLTGQGGLVLVGGEPGVGKTRLARELMREAQQRGCLCLTGHCYEMEGAPPFVPFVEILEQSVRLVPQAARAAMGDFAPEIAAIVPSVRRTYGDIPPFPEVPADQQRRLIFGAFLEYLQRGTQKSPCVFLLDDLHWADEPTLQLLLQLAPRLASMRLLAVGTYRDMELDVTRPFATTLESLLRRRLATRVALRRLPESGVQEMLAQMSGSAPPSGLATAVFRETEGNPFFVEEVYQHLSEEGKLFDASGAWKADLRVDTIEVPEGVRLVIGRRLERLGEPARKMLAAAAVIGRTFPLDLLQAVVDLSEDAVLDALEEAERAKLVASDASQRTARYGFVHELIRTTLVNGVSLPRRQRLHLRTADALERLRAAALDSQASVLAHHLYQAGAAADSGRTTTCLLLAARQALASGAFEETVAACQKAVALVHEMPPAVERDGLELSIREPLNAGLTGLRGWADAEVRQNAAAILELTNRRVVPQASGAGLWAIWVNTTTQGRIADSLEWAKRLLTEGEQAGDKDLQIFGHGASMISSFYLGELFKARAHGDNVLALYDPEQAERWMRVTAHDLKTLVGVWSCQWTWMLGYADQAVWLSDQKDRHARQIGDTFNLGFALTLGAYAFAYRCEPDRLFERVREINAVEEEHINVPFMDQVMVPQVEGMAQLRNGQPAKAIASLGRGLENWRARGGHSRVPYLKAVLAEAFVLNGDVDEGLRLIDECLEQIGRPGWQERSHLAEVLRLKGWMLLQRGRVDDAEASLRASIDWARHQEARSWELRSSTTLAELLRARGERDAARDLLTPIYGWFTEGFDTHDLRVARDLLDSLL